MKKLKKISLKKLFGLNLAILVPVLFIIIIAATTISSQYMLIKEAETSAEHLRDAAILKIENKMQEVEISVKSVAGYLESNLSDPDMGFYLTGRLVSTNPTVAGSAVAYCSNYFEGLHYYAPYTWRDQSTGGILSKQLGTSAYDYFSMEWYDIPASTGEPRWSEPYKDEGGGEYLMTTFSCPVKDASEKVIAVVTADVKLEDVSDFLSTIKPYPSSYVSLVDRSGNYMNIDHADRNNVKIVAQEDNPDGTGKLTFRSGKHKSFVVFGPLSNGWTLFITCDYKEILARTSLFHLALIILALAGLSYLFFKTSRSIKKYIQDLRSTTAANERFESELNIASGIQMAMLPADFPNTERLDIHALLKPAREVGGDFYDFFIEGNILYFSIGDVSGKGVPASMFMAITRSFFHFVAGMGLKMNEVVSKINNSICEGNKEGMFVTMFVGALNLETGELSYCNAGHNPILVNGEYLHADANLAVGLFEDFPYSLGQTVLPGGSQMLLYTDGVTEAERADKAEYGESRLQEKICSLGEMDSESICSEIYNDVLKFTDGNDQNDDITIMNIKLK